jgi:translation initiation factor 2 beta subunit (eIF-2beta)/eIF-5
MIKLTWRVNELSHKEFQQLDRDCKEQYLTFLQNLPKNDLSYNDQHILLLYGKVEPVVSNNFFKL